MRELPTGLALGAILGLIGIIRIALWQTLGIFDYGEHWVLVAITVGATLIGMLIREVRHGIRLTERNRNLLVDSCHVYNCAGVGVFFDRVNLHQTNVHGNHISYCKQGGIQVVGSEIRNRVALLKPEYWIGTDPTCPVCRPDDPFCEPRHARVYCNPKGSWQAENNKTHNGLWMRMSQVAVESVVQFQIGEQRFRLRVR